jgi:hypothetical protein
MRCITESSEDLRLQWAGVGELIVDGTLEVSERMLDSSPMLRARIEVEACKEVDSVLHVRACHASEILDRTEGREIGNRAHKLEFRGSGRSHVLGESDCWVHRSLDRVTVRHTTY